MGATPAALLGMRQFSQPPRECCDTPGCSLLYGHAGVHFIARKRRPPDVLDPTATLPGPSVSQSATTTLLAGNTHVAHTHTLLKPSFECVVRISASFCSLPGPLSEAAAARVRRDLKRTHDEGTSTSAACAEEASVSSQRPTGKQVAAASSEAPFALPAGCRVASPPPDEQLVFGSSTGDALIGRRLLYRWAGAGWCLGQVARRGTSASETVGRSKAPVNFLVYYPVDGQLASHSLRLEAYMSEATLSSPHLPYGTWLLLDELPAAAPSPPPAPSSAASSLQRRAPPGEVGSQPPPRAVPWPAGSQPGGGRRPAGAAMVGLRLRVWWEGDSRWFPGTVRRRPNPNPNPYPPIPRHGAPPPWA